MQRRQPPPASSVPARGKEALRQGIGRHGSRSGWESSRHHPHRYCTALSGCLDPRRTSWSSRYGTFRPSSFDFPMLLVLAANVHYVAWATQASLYAATAGALLNIPLNYVLIYPADWNFLAPAPEPQSRRHLWESGRLRGTRSARREGVIDTVGHRIAFFARRRPAHRPYALTTRRHSAPGSRHRTWYAGTCVQPNHDDRVEFRGVRFGTPEGRLRRSSWPRSRFREVASVFAPSYRVASIEAQFTAPGVGLFALSWFIPTLMTQDPTA